MKGPCALVSVVYILFQVNVTDDLLPVMVFIHGGGWVTGSGNSKHYSPVYLLDKDVVLVTVQYRLGPLG